MVAKYDVETLVSDIETLIKNNIGAKITAINSEKSDSITLKTPPANAFFPDLDDKAANYDPIILTAEANIQTDGIGPNTAEIVTVNVTLLLNDNSQDLFIQKRMQRYRRVLKEIIEDNFFYKRGHGQLRIESLPILDFIRQDRSLRYKVTGINVISQFA